MILVAAPVPLLLFALFFVKWYGQRTDFSKATTEFVQRQNQVMAYDTLSLARSVSSLLETALSAAEALSLVPVGEGNYRTFHQAYQGPVTEFDEKRRVVVQERIPLFNTLALLRPSGDEVFRFEEGKSRKPLRRLAECRELELCDRESREAVAKLPAGEFYFGHLMRWYRPESSTAPLERETLPIFFRSSKGIVEVGLDYRHLKSVMFAPTFPYNPRTDLMKAYDNGNYVYLIDGRLDFIAHPKYWHVTGIDRNTGRQVGPVLNDTDTGTHRLNVLAYKGDKLKEYFKRMLSQSFAHKSVDMFRAPNMGGINRVISVAPITVSRGQYKETGIFGHVSVGCNVDYFEEPTERLVPYY